MGLVIQLLFPGYFTDGAHWGGRGILSLKTGTMQGTMAPLKVRVPALRLHPPTHPISLSF